MTRRKRRQRKKKDRIFRNARDKIAQNQNNTDVTIKSISPHVCRFPVSLPFILTPLMRADVANPPFLSKL